MATRIQKLKWKLQLYKEKKLLIYGLKRGFITIYDDKLIEKLRNIYDGGMPASILLLSNGMSNGHCYDRATLMSRAFLDEEDDVNLIYATINSLKLKPEYICDDPSRYDHCIVERITKDGKKLIYDTSSGFIYDKKIYWLMENPKVRKINNKESIKRFIKEDEDRYPENIKRDKYVAPLILPMIETTLDNPNELYAFKGIELLQREIELYKNEINYTDVVDEIEEDMKRLGLKK